MIFSEILKLKPDKRIFSLKEKTLTAGRYLSVEQAKIITRIYQENEGLPVILKRSHALAASLLEMSITIDPEELIVGNRTPDIRAGVVFPEAGVSWIAREVGNLAYRSQDPFNVRTQDAEYLKNHLEPYWRGKTLEDDISNRYGQEIIELEKVVKINQKDHAQGHICPDVETWLRTGPSGLLQKASAGLMNAPEDKILFYESACKTLEASCSFIRRYGFLAEEMAAEQKDAGLKNNLAEIAEICFNLSERPPSGFREAVQSLWFLFVILHMESNASSFSPGRMDQYLLPFLEKDLSSGKTDPAEALSVLDCLFIKFNQIVYMRNEVSARYFAGFPTGFNITVGGQTGRGTDATNILSYLILKAHDHVRMPQPNLTARLHPGSPDDFLEECSRIIGFGTGMPQLANDESIIPALLSSGTDLKDAVDYALVGCVELSTQGNFLGWSDAAMFNLIKVLELTLNDGKCMMTGRQTGLETGYLFDHDDFESLEEAFGTQVAFFTERMTKACEVVEECHQSHLPSPFLSSVVQNCLAVGLDVTAGGAKYNFSGIQAIQAANLADCLAVLKQLAYGSPDFDRRAFLRVLQNNFVGEEELRQYCINRLPKYGNDIAWVDNLAGKWISYFAGELKKYTNYRGGAYQMGLYTVSAHVPMGANTGATPDGRLAGTPLADGGLSPMYGRDRNGPTAVLNSVSRIPSDLAGNGTLLNMKFLPSLFTNKNDRNKFTSLIKSFIGLPVHHVQFNVVTTGDLEKARANPEHYRDLTIRVAGYTAYFTELAESLQDEIISRTTHGES